MTEQPTNVVREAKGIHQSLKELLKSKEPFDKEVDFQRKNLRRRYLNLLLVHPYSKDAKDVENHLWMQTSYAFISSYKQRIAALDRVMQNNARQQNQQQPAGQPQHRQNSHVVEHRKLLQRFRQFLADEEKFWTQLILRIYRSFELNEARPTLVSLKLISGTSEVEQPAADIEILNPNSTGRNHFQFPPEGTSLSVVPATTTDREGRLAVLSKSLICLGDIARYRELYNEGNGRPKAGHEDAPPARRRLRRGVPVGSETFARPRNYEKAQLCYEQARLLVPYEGNPSHQLAILASYQKDSFTSLVHYYRALCVRQPYDTAAENLASVLSKALEQWRARTRREREKSGPTESAVVPPRVRIEQFKERVVVLHALWRLGLDKGIEKMDSIARKINVSVYDDFIALVGERHLPTDMISDSITLSQGALWKHRMIREPSKTGHNRKDWTPPSAKTETVIEWRILDHLFDLFFALLQVGKDELNVPPPIDAAENDLAQRITATFRRTLPALRIASKWLRANFKYITQDQESMSRHHEGDDGLAVLKETQCSLSVYSVHTIRFWKAYAEFIRILGRAFPLSKLPLLTAPLEEDIEMRGFLPLKKLMDEVQGDEKVAFDSGDIREQVHPNVEQLMRIADLLADGNILASMENSPLAVYGKHIVFKEEIIKDNEVSGHRDSSGQRNLEAGVGQQELLATIRDTKQITNSTGDNDEDNMTEITSKTDDDVVSDAFKFLNSPDQPEMEQDEQDDEIVWDLRAPISPTMTSTWSPPLHLTPTTPVKAVSSPSGHAPRSPTHNQNKNSFSTPTAQTMVAPTTAQDLLNDVMGVNRISGVGLRHAQHIEPSAVQPTFLFGSELSRRPSQSIWSASLDEQPLMLTGNGGPSSHHYHSPSRSIAGLSQDQSIWSSSYPNGTQSSQSTYIGALPSAPFALPPQGMDMGGHQRVPSSSMSSTEDFSNHNLVQHDPFGYNSPIVQPPIHRPGSYGLLPQLQMNPPLSPSSGGYYNHLATAYRHPPPHDPHIGHFTSAPMPQVWGNAG